MMDTVRLIIDVEQRLTPKNSPFKVFSMNPRGFPQAWVSDDEFADDCYHPQISYRERPILNGFTHELVIDVSLPKLLFGNNVEEVREENLDAIVSTLHSTLLDLGFGWLSEDDLRRARLNRADFCKNVIVDGRTGASNLIRTLKMANLSRVYKEYERDFDGGGVMVGWRLKRGKDVTFYDKTAEMISKDNKTAVLKMTRQSILRFEIKLKNTYTIKRKLKVAGIAPPETLTLESIFRDDICCSVVNYEFGSIYTKTPKANLDIGVWQMAQNIAAEEEGQRGGYTRWLKRVAYAILRQAAPNGASLDKLVEDAFGKHNKYAIHQIREPPIGGSQFKKLIAVKREIEEFKPLSASDLSSIISLQNRSRVEQ